jgi:OOP family OmpA-OmpF porin
MKNNVQISGVLAAIAAGAMLSGGAMAHSAGKTNPSYVGDAGGHYITDGSGNCVRTGTWKAEDMTVDCGAEPVVEAKAPPPPPPPPPAPTYETITLTGSALFAHDKAELSPEGKARMDEIADKITDKDKVKSIQIVGHTDSDGTESYNQALSLRRASTVRDYAVELGADPNVISVSGKGESEPVASNATREGKAQNRRVEVIVGVKQKQ